MRSNAEGRGHLAEGSSSVAKRCLHAPSFTVFKPARKRESKPAQISTSVHPVRELMVAHQRRAWAEGREESMADAGSSALPSFFCPLTLDLMRDPVSTEDGQTFEREPIEQWRGRIEVQRGTLGASSTQAWLARGLWRVMSDGERRGGKSST